MDFHFEQTQSVTAAAVVTLVAMTLAAVGVWRSRHTDGNRGVWWNWARRGLSIATVLFLAGGIIHSRQRETSRQELVFILQAARPETQQKALEFLRQAATHLKPDVRCGVIIVGEAGGWAVRQGTSAGAVRLNRWHVDASQARHLDLRAAIQIAATTVRDSKGNVLLVCDQGDEAAQTLEQTPQIDNSDIDIFVKLLSEDPEQGVFVEGLNSPNLIRTGESLDCRIALRNTTTKSQPVQLHLIEHQPDTLERDIETIEVQCPPGRAVVRRPCRFMTAGERWIRVQIGGTAPAGPGGLPREAWSALRVIEYPRVLLIEGKPDAARLLKQSLQEAGMGTSTRPIDLIRRPSDLRPDPVELRRYGGIALVNVKADDLTTAQLNALNATVREHRTGLVVFGGDQAFEMGQYAGSTLEKMLLPVVSADRHEKPEKPKYGLLFVVDVSGSQTGGGIDQTKMAVMTLIRELPDGSTIGVIAFDTSATVVQAPVTVGHDRTSVLDAVASLKPGGGTILSSGLQEAMKVVRDMKQGRAAKTEAGHVIVVSDGQLEPDSNPRLSLAAGLANLRWPVTTIGVGATIDPSTLQKVAQSGLGRSYLFPEIPEAVKEGGDTGLVFGMLRERQEPIFPVSDYLPGSILTIVADRNHAIRLKDWARLSVRFDAGQHPTALAYGRLDGEAGSGMCVAALFDVAGSWSQELLLGANRKLLLAQPVIFALREEDQDLYLPRVIHIPGGGWALILEARNDQLPEVEAELVATDSKTTWRGVLQRTAGHTYRVLLPEGAEILHRPLELRLRSGTGAGTLPPPVLPVIANPAVDWNSLRAGDENPARVFAKLEKAGAKRLDSMQDLMTAWRSVTERRAYRWWNHWAAVAVVTLVAADFATRSGRFWWWVSLYGLALAAMGIALWIT